MAKRVRLHEEVVHAEKHFTEFKWSLHDWSALYDGEYKKGIHSSEFSLEGTDGYTCKLSLEPTKSNPLTIEFSKTENIIRIGVSFSIANLKSYEHVYTMPFEKNAFSYYFHKSFDKTDRLYIFNDTECENDTLTILVKVSIIKKNDIISSTATTVKFPQELSRNTAASPTKILQNLKTLLDSKTLSDITFVIEDREFPAHRAILAAQSKVFERMFVTAMSEQTENRINLSNTDPDAFQSFLRYLYAGDLTDLECVVDNMLVLADFYEVVHLKIICQNLMMEKLRDENVIRYLIIADKLHCIELKEAGLFLIRNNPKILLKAFEEESCETLQCLREILSLPSTSR